MLSRCECGTEHVCEECMTARDLKGTYIRATDDFNRMAKTAGLLAPCTRCGERDSRYHVEAPHGS